MVDKSGPSDEQSKSLKDLIGFDYPDPFDDFEQGIAFLDAFYNFLRIEAFQGRANGIIAHTTTVEFTECEGSQIFYDDCSGIAICRLPIQPGESQEATAHRRIRALCDLWPAVGARNQRVASEIIKLMSPDARQRFLEKFSRRNGGQGNGE
jgi:hypothetical protein